MEEDYVCASGPRPLVLHTAAETAPTAEAARAAPRSQLGTYEGREAEEHLVRQECVIRVPVDIAARNCVWHCVGVRQRAAEQPARDRRVDADSSTVSDGRLDADDHANSCAT